MAVPILSRTVFRSRAPSWSSFLLTINLSHARHDTYESEDFVLQMEVSAVTEGSVMDVSAEMEVETTGHPLMTSTQCRRAGWGVREAGWKRE